MISSRAIYYLHPLLAGQVAGWQPHFARAKRLGFDTVLIAPPFQPGAAGNIFLTADHKRLHRALGDQPAAKAVSTIARDAEREGLAVMLDLVIDRVAADAILVGKHPGWFDLALDTLPDPRRPPEERITARLDFRNGKATAYWQKQIGEWLDTGIAGFHCSDAQRVPPPVWQSLIAAAKKHSPDTIFFASTPGADPDAMAALGPCGFDLASSSSWAWDFRADWLDDDAHRATRIGALVAMPELPFGARLINPIARRRALGFAAAYGQAWLMPMGFEFGAVAPLDPIWDRPENLALLMAAPLDDLSAEIVKANAQYRKMTSLGVGTTMSSPGADIAAIRRENQTGDRLIAANARTDQAAALSIRGLQPRLGAISAMNSEPVLKPGAVETLPLRRTREIRLPRPASRAALSATQASRIAIEAIEPTVDGGRFPVRRQTGETVAVEADIICDGHEVLAAVLLWRAEDTAEWTEAPMQLLVNDRWTASFALERLGRYQFAVETWLDMFGAFRDELAKKHDAGVKIALELQEGCLLVAAAANHSGLAELRALDKALAAGNEDEQLALLLAHSTAELMTQADDRPFRIRSEIMPVEAERQAASFASWYELFPRSQSGTETRHGTFDDVITRLPAVRAMGFDVLYFPPIHPIGTTHRKGRNNSLQAGADDPGSPYAIGSPEGGHDAIHPELGTLQDFRRLNQAAHDHGLEIALDFAIQCSPDHPWLKEHPDWFSWRPDGSVRHAENPPKKYEDIVNVAFYAKGAMPSLWVALRDVVLFWANEGVRIFRVDNPHTKPLPFWEWMIAEVRGRYPDAIFLAEAFTKPKMMYRLAKIGFSQSYSYFTWRNTAAEMREYLTELTTTAPAQFFRPHFFVNTPDINPLFLQRSGRAGFLLRAALATTLSGLWGVYSGFELGEAAGLPGKEEYADSEKYALRAWDWNQPGNIIAEITRLNRIRRANPALHTHLGVRFLPCSSDAVLCFVKATPDFANVLIIAVSFDPNQPVEADIDLMPAALGLANHRELPLEDLMYETNFTAHTGFHRLRLDPSAPFTIWRLRRPEQA